MCGYLFIYLFIYRFTFVSCVLLWYTLFLFFYYLSEKKSFTVYTHNDISTYHMFPNTLNFKLKKHDSNSNGYIEIFLMTSNPNVLSGDMYYIQLQKDYVYDYNYRYSHNRIQGCKLRKCTSDHGSQVTIHRDLRYGCDIIENDVSKSVNFKLWINLIFLLLEFMCPDKLIA
jgi:hypothetical protein